jgi:hypothetical protein
MATAQEVAQWMLDEVTRKGELHQETAASDIALKFGLEFTYDNENGNLAIRRDVLAAFRILTENSVVWDRENRLWRKRDSEKRDCWAVLCRNSKHGSGGYPIPLSLVERDSDIRGTIQDSFVVRCEGCEQESTYSASDIRNWSLTLPEGWEPHPLFRKS